MSIFSSGPNDVFRTQADNRFNSFTEPMNAVNMNPGAWGVNSNYLTPPYLSPFRPQYQGPNGPSYQGFKPSFGTSVNQVFNPLASGGENYGGNYMQQQSPYYDKLANGPVDAAASFTQNWVVPGIASWAAYKYWGGASTKIGRAVGSRLVGGAMMGAGFGTEAATMGIRAGGMLGGVAAGLMLPMLATQAAVAGVDKAVFDPYVSQRRMSGDLRENFRGVNFGDGTSGDTFTGGGLSRRKAAQIARQTSQAGAMDMTFNQEETSLITDYASRSGLMDNVNPDQMSKRFESIMKQMKVVMAVANTSDFRETIEIMSKMQMAGASGAQLSGVMGRLGASAAAGGQSIQKLLNTVGMQGQYLFAAQGLTPYVGHEAAFTSNAAMSAAYRNGLLSPTLMARMGGVEGATQSAVAAQIASYRTPYSTMQASNAYLGGGETGSVMSNLAQFGGRMSSNVLQNVGRHELMAGALTSRHIQDRGLMGEEDQIYQLAKQLPNGIGPDGKVDAGVAYQIMTNMMGMTPDMAQAKIAQIHTYNDPNSVKQMLAGNQRASIDSLLKYQQQEGLNKGIFSTPINAVKRGAMHVQKAAAGVVGEVLEDVGGMGDSLQNWANEAFFGVDRASQSNKTLDFDQLGKSETQQFDMSSSAIVKAQNDRNGKNYAGTRLVSQLEKINKAAREGDKDAIKFLNSKGTERSDALDKLSSKGKVGSEYTSSEDANKLMDLAGQLNVQTVRTDDKDVKTLQNTLGAGLDKVLPGSNVSNTLKYMTAMEGVYGTLSKGDDVDDETKKKIAELKDMKPEDLTRQKLREMSEDYLKTSSENRVFHVAGMQADSLEDLASQMKNKGMALQAPQIKTSGDIAALKEQRDLQLGNLQARQRIQQLAKDGKIDTNAAMGAINALDNGQTVGKFGTAVDKFVEAVGGMKGDQPKNDGLDLWSIATGRSGPGRLVK